MSDGKISVTYVVNSSQYNKNLADMKKNMQLLNQQVRTSATEVNTYGKNIKSLSKQQSSINQALAQSKKIMSEYESALSKNSSTLEKNKSKLSELAKQKEQANQAYKESIKTYGKEAEETKKAKQALDDATDAYKRQEKVIANNENSVRSNLTQIERTKQEQLKLKQQLDKTNKAIEEQSNKFIHAAEGFAIAGSAFEKAGGNLKELGSEAQQAGVLILTASAGLATMAAGFETGLAKVNTLIGDSKDGVKKYGEAVMELSNNTGVGVVDLTDSLYDAISAGVDYSQSIQFIDDVNRVAVGGFTDIASASNLLTQVMNIYGNSVDDVGDISNKLFLVQKNGVTTVGQLASSMGEAMTMGASYNVNLENILSSYASLTKQGRTASTAQTQLKSMIKELGDTGSKVGEVLEGKTAKSFTELMNEGNSLYDVLKIVKDSCEGNEDAFNNLWSSTEAGLSAMSLLSKDGEYFNSTLNEMSNSAGLTDEAFNMMADTSEYKFKKSINEAKNSLIKLGESLLPLMDEVSKGISDISKFISKLNPQTVVAVAKFGALAIAFGTVMKATGSLVTVLGKGANGISGLLKIAADTKSLGSFSKALGQSDSAVGGLVKSMGGLTLKGGLIGLAVAGVGALGTALYMNQKEIEKSEEAYASLDGKIGEFTGRLKSNESTWASIFGKEYSWKFSEEYKSALANSETDVANWCETLKGYQQQIYDILNSTEIDQQTKDEQIGTIIKNTIGAGDINAQIDSLIAGMQIKGFSDKDIATSVNNFKKSMEGALVDIANTEAKGLELVKKYTTTTVDEVGNTITNVDWDGFNKEFEGYLSDTHSSIVATQQTNYDDLMEIQQKYVDEQTIIYGEALEGSAEYNQKNAESIADAKRKEVEANIQSAKEHGVYTKDYAKRCNEQLFEIKKLETSQKGSLLRRALFDAEYAETNKMSCKKIDENMTLVKDSITGLEQYFFDNGSAMEEWASKSGYTTSTVTDDFGNSTKIVVDSLGNVIAQLNDTSTSAVIFSNEAKTSLDKFIEAERLTEATSEQKFSAICKAIDEGRLSAEQFGMTDAEFKSVADEMLNGANKATTLKDNLNSIPESVDSNVKVKGLKEANSEADTLLASLQRINGSTFVGSRTPQVQQKQAGGYVTESGIVNVNELGPEIIEPPFGTYGFSLGDAVQGEYAYLPKNTKVTNAVMTAAKMENMIDSKLSSALGVYLKEMNKILSSNNASGNTNIKIDNAHFETKEDENRTVNNVKRIINSMK